MNVRERYRLKVARKGRINRKVQKNKDKLRLTVFKTSKHIYAQIIDDRSRKTLVAESTMSPEFKNYGSNKDAAKWVGESLGSKANVAPVVPAPQNAKTLSL